MNIVFSFPCLIALISLESCVASERTRFLRVSRKYLDEADLVIGVGGTEAIFGSVAQSDCEFSTLWVLSPLNTGSKGVTTTLNQVIIIIALYRKIALKL